MLASHLDPRRVAENLQLLEMGQRIVVDTVDEVVVLQEHNPRVEATPAKQMDRDVFAVTLRPLTVREAADAAGLTAYDTALPQPWVDWCTSVAGDPRRHFVWSYDHDPVCGAPFPLTTRGADLQRQLDSFDSTR